MDKIVFKMMDIPVFSWENWDEFDTDITIFYDVEFEYDSMKQYNGQIIFMWDSGYMEISDGIGNVLWNGYPINIKEYSDIFKERYF